MLGFLKKTLYNIYNQFTGKISELFKKNKIDNETLKELEKILITSDTGIKTTRNIIEKLKSEYESGKIEKGTDLQKSLNIQLKNLLQEKIYNQNADVYLLVGINGSGKTTFASKLASWLKNQNKKVLLIAADTFRAAAKEQLTTWAERLSIPIIKGKENQDPASLVFQGCQEYLNNNYNALIIDTAGRLQTKVNLMKELEKIKKTILKILPDKKISTLLTVDAMLGQNSFDQAKIFNESTNLDGIVLTKMDGTGKGGIVFSISQELKIPIAFISFGEQIDQLKVFDPEEYVNQLTEMNSDQ